MAKYHGNKGSMTYAGSAVAELLEWRITGIEVPMADVTVKQDTVKTFDGSGPVDPGIVTAVCYLDLDGTGQSPWSASILAGTGASVAFACLTDSGKDMTFNAIRSRIVFERRGSCLPVRRKAGRW